MGAVVDGISKAVGGIGKSIGGPIGDLLGGVAEFAQSPLGKMAITAGLAFFTGGSSLLAGGGLEGMLGGALSSGGLSSALGGLFGSGGTANLFGSMASQFLGDAGSGTSMGGLTTLLDFSKGLDSGGLLDMMKSLDKAQSGQPQMNDGSEQGQLVNLQQLLAMRQAESITG